MILLWLASVTVAGVLGTCQDLTVTTLGSSWVSDTGLTCAQLGQDAIDAQGHLREAAAAIPNAVMEQLQNSRTLGQYQTGPLSAIMDATVSAVYSTSRLANPCPFYRNWFQSRWPGFTLYDASEACCACGGGSSANQTTYPDTLLGLRELYQSTNGPSWHFRTGWSDPSDNKFCNWPMLRCDGQGRLLSIFSLWNNLTGLLPTSLGHSLSSLQTFLLGPRTLSVDNGNGVSGTLPASISSLTNLTFFGIMPMDTSLSGTLPPIPASLRVLALLSTKISGTLPETFVNAESILSVQTNLGDGLSGTLLPEWGTNGQFISMALVNTDISGSLPPFKNAPSVTCLAKILVKTGPAPAGGFEGLLNTSGFAYDGKNFGGITGTLPKLADVPNLQHLSLTSQGISGTLPNDIFAQGLHTLWLTSNPVSGSLPPVPVLPPNQIGMGSIDLSMAQLQGSLPSSLGNLRNISHLNIRDNSVSGTLPSSIGGLAKLQNLFLFGNPISGSLPSAIGNLTALINIVFNDARLSGSLPTSFGSLSRLRVLDLSVNFLTGDLQHLKPTARIANLHLQTNMFSGTLPPLSSASSLVTLLLFSNRISGTLAEPLLPGGPLSNSSIEYLSFSLNRLSGTLSPHLCSLTKLVAFTVSSMSISGDLPSCLGSLSSLGVLSLARNYLKGSISSSMNGMTSLRTVFLFSNWLECNAPGLDQASNLGQGEFLGLNYPANKELSKSLRESTGLEDFSARVKPAFKANNAVLIYTGNGRLTTSAAILGDDTAPNSLQKDEILQGRYGLFSGQSERKQFWFLIAPASLLVFLSVMGTVVFYVVQWSPKQLWKQIKDATSGAWETEHQSLRRLVRHTNMFSPYALGVGTVLIIFYFALALEDSCFLDISVSSLLLKLYPWNRAFVQQTESVQQWLFTTAVVVLYVGTWKFCSQLKRDDRAKRAHRVYQGILAIAYLDRFSHGLLFGPIDTWKRQALGSDAEMRSRRRISKRQVVVRVVVPLLHALLAIFFSLPTLFYTMALNVQNLPAVLTPFRQALFVVACNMALKKQFLPKAAFLLGRLGMWGRAEDFIKFNGLRLNTLYLMHLTQELVAPILATMLFDENCFRYYLEFSADLNNIMTNWEISMRGTEAYRRGFCIPKVITIYSGIWNTTAMVQTLLVPSFLVLGATPQVRKLLKRLSSAVQIVGSVQADDTMETEMEKMVQTMQSRSSELLNSLTIGLALGAWVPSLLLFLALLGPVTMFTEQLCDLLLAMDDEPNSAQDTICIPNPTFKDSDPGPSSQDKHRRTCRDSQEQFCEQFVSLIKVPPPKSLAIKLTAAAVCGSLLLVLLDFGFAIGPWVVFAGLLLAQAATAVLQNRKKSEAPPEDEGPTIEMKERSLWAHEKNPVCDHDLEYAPRKVDFDGLSPTSWRANLFLQKGATGLRLPEYNTTGTRSLGLPKEAQQAAAQSPQRKATRPLRSMNNEEPPKRPNHESERISRLQALFIPTDFPDSPSRFGRRHMKTGQQQGFTRTRAASKTNQSSKAMKRDPTPSTEPTIFV